jgi:signal transduction histidine kinase
MAGPAARGRELFQGIRAKLALAFLAASILPMLFAAELATNVMNRVFEANVGSWLGDSAEYFLSSMLETQGEAVQVARYLAEAPDGVADRIARGGGAPVVAPHLQSLSVSLGYDLLMVYDAQRHTLFTSRPVHAFEEVPLTSERSLYSVELDGRAVVMAAGAHRFQVAGTDYFVLLGTFLDSSYISNLDRVAALELRLYYSKDGRLREFYSSRGNQDPDATVPADVLARFQASHEPVFEPEADGDDDVRAVYLPIRSSSQDLIGVVFCGVRVADATAGWLARNRLFLTIFVVGIALSVGGGMFVSRWLVLPIRRLSRFVRALGDGAYGEQVPVSGPPEIADLATAFNQMSVKLRHLQNIEEQLRRRDRFSSLGEVAVGIAHEVRNPLGIIKTSAELIDRKGVLPPAEAKLLRYVIEETRRIDHLISEFMGLARPAPPALLPMAPAEPVERVLSFADTRLREGKVTAAFEDHSGGALVRGDADQLFSALLNLVLNALDAMPEGGRLTIALHRRGGELAIEVSDTGIGIPDELRERIFNPFFTTKASGTGLGLPKVFSVMESHGGRVECASSPGHGATFRLILPVYQPAAAEAAHG